MDRYWSEFEESFLSKLLNFMITDRFTRKDKSNKDSEKSSLEMVSQFQFTLYRQFKTNLLLTNVIEVLTSLQ